MGPSIFIDGEGTKFQVYGRRGGKLQWGRRSSSTERHGKQKIGLDDDGFNGAVDLHRRRGADRQGAGGQAMKLQWGRRSSSTESEVLRNGLQSLVRLQWGRRSSSTERLTAPPATPVLPSLQWGRRSS